MAHKYFYLTCPKCHSFGSNMIIVTHPQTADNIAFCQKCGNTWGSSIITNNNRFLWIIGFLACPIGAIFLLFLMQSSQTPINPSPEIQTLISQKIREQEIAREKARDEEMQRANARGAAAEIYRNGGACWNCAYNNATSFCDKPGSDMYNKQTFDTEAVYGVKACPYWKKR